MTNWKDVPATAANLFVVANIKDQTLRLVFGERFDQGDEGAFHGAIQISHESARLLIDLLEKGFRASGRWGYPSRRAAQRFGEPRHCHG